jgi:hypothetical protein
MSSLTPPRLARGRRHSQAGCFLLVGILVGWLHGAGRCPGADFDQPPINYRTATPSNRVSDLQKKLDAGRARLTYDRDHGFLKSLLRELDVPLSSQMLVFSKTSLQRQRIGPKTPRAIYFNDDVYVGFCWLGDVLEVSAVDAKLGTVFYTLDQQDTKAPEFKRRGDTCLICHGSSLTQNVPGHLVRSLFADRQGFPVLSLGSIVVDHTTPFAQRWGGWYVTGTSGKQTHRGNLTVPPRTKFLPEDNPGGINVTDLRSFFTVANYLTPHSDIVALMVLEHQTEMHNRITRANFETRLALRQQEEFDRILGRKTMALSESTANRIKSCCEPLLQHLLFAGEAPLSEKVQGTSTFAQEFAARGPKDRRGRSLRYFDLKRRMFQYPCSYLIYTRAFDGLPLEAKEYIYRRLLEVLDGKDHSAEFAHLSTADRKAIREILSETKPDLPKSWKRD